MSRQATLPAAFRPPWALAGLPQGTPVAVALSGGADSVALLHMLLQAGGPLSALHVHHGIRGAEADRDADFCRDLTEKLGVPLTVIRLDVPALAAERGVGLETAAREARYRAFADYMKEHDVPLLATAHHADDQLETLLQNLLRGSGRRGLCGIPACRPLGSGFVVRPLLQVSKAQIRAYCEENHLAYVTDSTNEEPVCPRNRLRSDVLPVLAELWPAGAVCAARCAAALSDDEAYLSELARDFSAREGQTPRIEALAALPRPIFVRVMQSLLPCPPEAVHIEALARLVREGKPNASLSLPAARVQVRNGRLVVLVEPPLPAADYEITLRDGENKLPGGLGVAVLTDYGEEIPLEKDRYAYAATVEFSSAAVCGTLTLRNRRAGDRILAGKRHKAVRKLPSMSAFSPEERARMPLLCDADGVLAVPFGPVRDGAGKAPDKTLYLFFD